MTYRELLYKATRLIDKGEITLGEYEEMTKPLDREVEQEPRWIPVSERLPEDSGEYFVTVIDEDVETYKHTGIAWYAHPKDYDVEEGEWRELMIDEKVIAWMPLPQAYREVVENET